MSRQELAIFTRQLATLLGAGVNIHAALEVLSRQVRGEVVTSLTKLVGQGNYLSQAMSRFPEEFPVIYVGLIKVGEKTGNLTGSLERLADWVERDSATRQRVTSALIYPSFVIGVTLASCYLLMTFVAPGFLNIFAEQRTPLPWPTQALKAFIACQRNPLFWVAVIAGLAALRRQRLPLERIPVVKELVSASAWARWCSAAQVMFSAGLSPLAVYPLAAEASGDRRLVRDADHLIESLKHGDSASRYFLQRPELYPAAVGHCLGVAEDSGRMPAMMAFLARNYEVETQSRIDVLGTLVEPLVLAFASCLLLFLILALVTPLYAQLRLVAP